ncbi:helix-turn-helix domain-containing protein [Microbacterium resistens]|uniref:Helix-turn-helix domain-containing protein n=1 Tax=Microbacterium resistens TaxID=156977 RepID=A0ABY3RWF2_9MICO|nr:helix-turn-helix domain-containing protein [Microbacterium resistens]UGS28374.1 helix-turn-helix domain-containing protein [Microbacterium resistens]
MPRPAHAYRSISQPARLRLLHEIQRHPGVLARDLADRLSTPINTVRDHLAVLVREGLIVGEPQHRATRGRPAIAYRTVVDHTESIPAARRITDAERRGALLRATIGGAPRRPALDEDVLRQLDVVYEHLDEVGLQPRIDEDALTVELTPCALYAADDNYETACQVHACLVRDLLRQTAGPLVLNEVVPFFSPSLCLLTLRHGRAEETPAGAG